MSIFIVTTALFFTTTAVFLPFFFILKEKVQKIRLELKKAKDDFKIE